MTDIHGLSAAEVRLRTNAGHTNATRSTTSRTLGEIFRAHVFTRFNGVLGVLFVAVLIAQSPGDGLFGLVLLANSTIGVIQEWSAKRKLDALAILHEHMCSVMRDGTEISIPQNEIVIDEVVVIKAGDQVPADGTVLSSHNLEINESNLTGESESIAKNAGDTLLSGTIATAGYGYFVTTSVGSDAYAHRLAAEARIFTRVPSEIQSSITKVLKWVTWILLAVTPLQIWSHFHKVSEDGWQEHIVRITAGLVGLVPEGLVLLTTMAFLSAALSLSRQNVLVQELPAVETLARVDVVCIDKTGTLTSGEMNCGDIELLTTGELSAIASSALAALANDASANNTLRAIQRKYSQVPPWVSTATVPFDSSRKWKAESFQHRGSWFLGAPEMLWKQNDSITSRVAQLASSGKRVMLLCHSPQEVVHHQLPSDVAPVAIVTLTEEIRSDAASTLAYFAKQDVRVIVISGDNPKTVESISHSVGVDGIAVDARTLGESEEEMIDALRNASIFGRVTPEQKRHMVLALQKEGHVVAMTGDGVNDALALKRAEIGIAMDNAAPATKAVAQLVLLDGKFSHLPHVLSEGRRVIGNVERVANLFMAKNAMSLVAILGAVLAGITFPILPRQMTLLSSVAIGIPAFVLALGSNTTRYRPGFLRRIMLFAWPAGAIAGAVSITTHLWTGDDTGTAATVGALMSFFAILAVQSRPFNGWRLLLHVGMMATAASTFVIAGFRNFFGFSITSEIVWKSLLCTSPVLVLIFARTRKWLQEVL